MMLYELWCWRRLLRVPWTARRSNQSILKEIRPKYSMEGLMRKLKLQPFGHLMQRTDSFEKTLMLGKIEGRRRKRQLRMRWLDGITDSMDIGLGTPQFKSINSLVLSCLYGPTLTSIHGYGKNHSFDFMDLCQQSNVSAF